MMTGSFSLSPPAALSAIGPVCAIFLSLASLAPAAETNLPPDPFGDIELPPEIPGYAMELDRTRGSFSLDAEDGKYQAGSHFAHWNWTASVPRWGHYYVGLRYDSKRPKLGVQVRVGEKSVLKGYAGRTGGSGGDAAMILGKAYIAETGEHPVTLLTGDQSNGPAFAVRSLEFIPAPESDPLGQSIDGTIELVASSATTFSENMRYEPKPEKNCLGFWTEVDDWAEWSFEVSSPGEFQLKVEQGCGEGQGGSQVAVLVDDQTVEFDVEDTGGFQNWKTLDLGKIELEHPGVHRLALKPLTKKAKAVVDIRKVLLVPVKAGGEKKKVADGEP